MFTAKPKQAKPAKAAKITKSKSGRKKERWLVTAALPYVNNFPHIGVIVGSHLPADIFARFLRLFGEDVVFVGGTDEHGSPTEVAAYQQKLTPKEFCDKFYVIHNAIYKWLGISYDNFSRTSNPVNHEMTRKIFLKIYKKGLISRKKLLLPYCPQDKRFLPDRWVEGKCPYCGRIARGDQCAEGCTKLLEPSELVEPYCVICRSKPEFREMEHLFLELPKLSDKIKNWIVSNKHWKDNVRNLALGWIKEGLKSRCITRDLQWGVKVPLKGFEDKVFYVWIDAPIGYISATIEWAEQNKKPDEWKKYWCDKSSKIIHFIGKDNIPFHTIIWPALLMGDGDFNLPYQIGGYEFLNYEGNKISKSKNWGIFLETTSDGKVKVRVRDQYIDVEPDLLRYYLSEILPENKDSDFVWSEFENKVNGELVGNLGNFIYRVLSFTKNNFDGVVPKPGKLGKEEKEIEKKIGEVKDVVKQYVYELKIRDAQKKIFELSKIGNQYFQNKQPWETLKSNPDECRTAIYTSINLVKSLAILSEPFLPFSAEKIWKQLNLEGSVHEQKFDDLDKSTIKAEHKIGEIKPLFKKFEK